MKKTTALLALALTIAFAGFSSLPAATPQTAAKPATAPAKATALSPATVLPSGFDAYVAKVMKTFEVPGMAVAVVKDGQVVLAKGYGVRKLGEPAPVDAQTLFGIASNTKVFTAAALGLLVEEGKIEWDGPVTRYLPWFQMWDPYVTREMTVRDLLVHRSGLGLGAGDLLLWPESNYTRREIVGRLRFIRPATSFRTAYAYDNMLYIAAGEVIEAVSGMTWEDFISERILKRAGMASSRPRHDASLAGGNVAIPHAVLEKGPAPVAIDENDNMNAAGGIISCAEDMARWMLVHLGEGALPDGTRLFSERTGRELATIVTPIPISAPPAELAAQRMNFNGYALGLRVSDYRGRKVVNHTGGLSGYVSRVFMVPELELGIAVLTNQESSDAYNSVIYAVVDKALGRAADGLGGRLPQDQGAGVRVDERIPRESGNRARRVPQAFPAARGLCPDLRGRLVRPDRRHARGRGRGRQAGHELHEDRRASSATWSPGAAKRSSCGGATGSSGPTPSSRSSSIRTAASSRRG